MTEVSRLGATLYVGGLAPEVNAQILSSAFIPFGEIVDVNIPKPEAANSSEPHRGFGYVEFELAEDAKEAMDNMDQSELFGRVIKVAKAKALKDKNEGLGSSVALWETVAYFSMRVCANISRRAIYSNTMSAQRINLQLRVAVVKSIDH
jgi:RNA recognition motif-containing protein